MPGWNLREGILTELRVSDDEYWSLFNFVFSDACRKTNTYKFGLIKSICDQIYDVYDDGNGLFCLMKKYSQNLLKIIGILLINTN
jgi:hypothetical protein